MHTANNKTPILEELPTRENKTEFKKSGFIQAKMLEMKKVRKYQKVLKKEISPELVIDGIWGKKTQIAWEKYLINKKQKKEMGAQNQAGSLISEKERPMEAKNNKIIPLIFFILTLPIILILGFIMSLTEGCGQKKPAKPEYSSKKTSVFSDSPKKIFDTCQKNHTFTFSNKSFEKLIEDTKYDSARNLEESIRDRYTRGMYQNHE